MLALESYPLQYYSSNNSQLDYYASFFFFFSFSSSSSSSSSSSKNLNSLSKILQRKKPPSMFYRGSLFLIIWISFKISASFLKLCIDHKHDYYTSNLALRLLPMTLHHRHPDQCPFLWLWPTPVFAFFLRIYSVNIIA